MYSNSEFSKEYKLTKKEEGGKTRYKIKVLATDDTVEIDEEVYKAFVRSYWKADKDEERNRIKELSFDRKYNENSTGYNFIAFAVDTPEQMLLDAEEYQYMRLTFKQLSDNERQMLTDIVIKGMSIREYAEKTGIPRSTIEYRKKKAIEKLKKTFLKNY